MSEQKEKDATKPTSEMTAYERWELPSLSGGEPSGRPTRPETVKPLTANDLEQIRQEAYQDGFNQGQREGQKQGVEEGRKVGLEKGKEEGLRIGQEQAKIALQADKQALESLCSSLLKPIEEQREAVEQVLLNTTLALVRSVIHAEIGMNSEVIKQALIRCIDSLPKHANDVCIQLNPQDLLHAKELIQALAPQATVRPDAAIARGGCVVETSDQVLDFTVEKRYQLAVQAMLMDAAKSQNFEVHQETPESLQSHTDYSNQLLQEGERQAVLEQQQTASDSKSDVQPVNIEQEKTSSENHGQTDDPDSQTDPSSGGGQ